MNDCVVKAWSQDFITALMCRPWIFRVLLRLVFGRYAYNEFIGLVKATGTGVLHYDLEYELKGMDYHKEKNPLDFTKLKEPNNG